ncbi:hypothetical protein [Nocardia ignorata]|uniref:Uncharacterized protein n=1 Tax=Nocardia ignorata TaxID=145285 RepID=A0A4R6NYI4_NOCIG|nr:hypothetical protein [Nocardia ignorata]TDP29820.1 hypothetical protein DFR75_11288 [Nocardia ignorata]
MSISDHIGGYASPIYERVEELAEAVDWTTGTAQNRALRDYLHALNQITTIRTQAEARLTRIEEARAELVAAVDQEAKEEADRERRSQAARKMWARRKQQIVDAA